VVIACKNVQTGSKVAVKKISPMCASTTDGKHTLRELRLCRHLGRHDNIISLKDIVVDIPEDTIYLVMKLYDTDLHKIIQSPQPLGDAHLKHFLYQLLRGLKFAHSYQIIHRDLKPANLVRVLRGGRGREKRAWDFTSLFFGGVVPSVPLISFCRPPATPTNPTP
jgi:serine/threonine protein kinase